MKNIFFLLLLFPLTSCTDQELGWFIISPNNVEGLTNLKFLLSGLTTTIYISLVSIIISMILGLIVAIPSLAKNKFLTYINIGYVEIVRAVPLLVLILWIYYGLPIMTGISFSPFVSGIIALAISESAFQAEIFRAGINSIKKAQWEAGSSLGLNFFKRLRLVILPQAIKNILPAIGNQFVYVLKMSSLVSITKNKYIQMLKQKYISCLVNLTKQQIRKGIKEIIDIYPKKLIFNDILICIKYQN